MPQLEPLAQEQRSTAHLHDSQVFDGACRCGSVKVTLSPALVHNLRCGYCHCFSCRKWYSAPCVLELNWDGGAPGDGFEIQGETRAFTNALETHTMTHYRCASCFAPVAARVEPAGESAVFWSFPLVLFQLEEGQPLPASLPKPSEHYWYSNRVMDVKDGLPKWSAFAGESELL